MSCQSLTNIAFCLLESVFIHNLNRTALSIVPLTFWFLAINPLFLMEIKAGFFPVYKSLFIEEKTGLLIQF